MEGFDPCRLTVLKQLEKGMRLARSRQYTPVIEGWNKGDASALLVRGLLVRRSHARSFLIDIQFVNTPVRWQHQFADMDHNSLAVHTTLPVFTCSRDLL